MRKIDIDYEAALAIMEFRRKLRREKLIEQGLLVFIAAVFLGLSILIGVSI